VTDVKPAIGDRLVNVPGDGRGVWKIDLNACGNVVGLI
jgi:hypothetical protein